MVAGLADGELPARFRTARMAIAGAPGVLVCGTGYTGEDGVELLIAPGTRARSGTPCSRAAPRRLGLGARDTLRLEVCFHLYGNDLMEERGPIEAGLGWCCKEDTGLHRRRGRARGPRGRPGGEARPVHDDRPGHRPPGQPGRGRRRGDLRHHVALPGHRHRHGLRAAREGRARHPDRDRRPRQGSALPRSRPSRCTPRSAERGRRELSRRPQVPPRARLGAHRRRRRHVRDHLVRAGPAGGGRVRRPARGRQDGEQGRAVRRDRVGEGGVRRGGARCRARSSRSTRRSATSPRRSTRTRTATAGWSRCG